MKINFIITSNHLRILTLLLIFIQSIGHRYFQGQGFILSGLIVILNLKYVKFITFKSGIFILISVIYLILLKLTNSSIFLINLVYLFSLLLSAYLFILSHDNNLNQLRQNFVNVLRFISIHAFMGFILAIIIPSVFSIPVGTNSSFLYLFYVSKFEYFGLHRNSGLCWEPGLLQLVANLYLFYSIKQASPKRELFLAGIVVVSTFSTAGIGILGVNFLYYLSKNLNNLKSFLYKITPIIFFLILFFPIAKKNILDKTSGENMSSGLIRLRDLLIGIDLIKEHPFLGHGLISTEYLRTKLYVYQIEKSVLTKAWIDYSGQMAGGFTNGLLGVIAAFGIPISIFIFIAFYKNSFVIGLKKDRIIFCFIILLSMISEPIGYTSLFFIFPLSYILTKKIQPNH